MDETAFWELIDRARGEGAGPQTPSTDPERLGAILEVEPDERVAAFAIEFGRHLDRLNEWRLWRAGDVICPFGDMSGDYFHYFRAWLIGKGKAAVEQALVDPDGLVEYVDDPEVWNEVLEYVPVEICESRGLEDPRGSYAVDADADARGEPIKEGTESDAYPKLAAAFA